MELRIGAIEKFSTIDYPDKISCAIFLKGCNFFCGFCYNKQLVCKELLETTPDLPLEELKEFLNKRIGLIDAVVVSGGEPTIYGDALISFIREIKTKGYLIKLDTNGSNPKILNQIISENLVDYIAMDLKDSFENYEKYTFVPVENIKESINLILNSNIAHEFRVTTHPELTLENFNILLTYVPEQMVFVQDFMNTNTIKEYPEDSKTIFSELSKEDKRYILR